MIHLLRFWLAFAAQATAVHVWKVGLLLPRTPASLGAESCELARCSQRCYNLAMVKHLQAVGNSSGIIIDKPILELLRITPETELEVTTDGNRLIITPLRAEATRRSKIARAQARTIANHERTFRKLAK